MTNDVGACFIESENHIRGCVVVCTNLFEVPEQRPPSTGKHARVGGQVELHSDMHNGFLLSGVDQPVPSVTLTETSEFPSVAKPATVGRANVRCGACSWADRGLTHESDFYPK